MNVYFKLLHYKENDYIELSIAPEMESKKQAIVKELQDNGHILEVTPNGYKQLTLYRLSSTYIQNLQLNDNSNGLYWWY